MCSQKSRRVPMFAEHEEALRSALVEVAERSFFAFAAASDPEQFTDLVAHPPVMDPEAVPGPVGWLVTRVAFSGAFRGHVEVAMSDVLASQLLCAFVGLGPDEPIEEGQLRDSCGEFCNQVCGTWLTRACQSRRFDLAPPQVARHPPGWLPAVESPRGAHEGQVLVTLNDMPLRLGVVFEPEIR